MGLLMILPIHLLAELYIEVIIMLLPLIDQAAELKNGLKIEPELLNK
jgi:hypothetical protein